MIIMTARLNLKKETLFKNTTRSVKMQLKCKDIIINYKL